MNHHQWDENQCAGTVQEPETLKFKVGDTVIRVVHHTDDLGNHGCTRRYKHRITSLYQPPEMTTIYARGCRYFLDNDTPWMPVLEQELESYPHKCESQEQVFLTQEAWDTVRRLLNRIQEQQTIEKKAAETAAAINQQMWEFIRDEAHIDIQNQMFEVREPGQTLICTDNPGMQELLMEMVRQIKERENGVDGMAFHPKAVL